MFKAGFYKRTPKKRYDYHLSEVNFFRVCDSNYFCSRDSTSCIQPCIKIDNFLSDPTTTKIHHQFSDWLILHSNFSHTIRLEWTFASFFFTDKFTKGHATGMLVLMV